MSYCAQAKLWGACVSFIVLSFVQRFLPFLLYTVNCVTSILCDNILCALCTLYSVHCVGLTMLWHYGGIMGGGWVSFILKPYYR